MKHFLILALVFLMLLAITACGDAPATTTESSSAETTLAETTTGADMPAAPAVNEGVLKAGIYTAAVSSEDASGTFRLVLTLRADGTFVLKHDGDERAEAGTYVLTDTCYTLTDSDGGIFTFVVQKDGTLKLTSDLTFCAVTLAGDIVFTYQSEIPSEEDNGDKDDEAMYTLEAGKYTASYGRDIGMGDTAYYDYVITVGEDGYFSYAVTYFMSDQLMNGLSAEGTYVLDGNKLTFTDSEGNVTEGRLTADNELTISLRATQMSQQLYEITAKPPVYTLAAGTYGAIYEKEESDAETVSYTYIAIVGADNTFSYSVSIKMGEAATAGASASGTYTLAGNVFTFTDSEGNVTEGKLTDNNEITISLMASQMEGEEYEVSLIPATIVYN